jgi:hypothetical protein
MDKDKSHWAMGVLVTALLVVLFTLFGVDQSLFGDPVAVGGLTLVGAVTVMAWLLLVDFFSIED